MKKKLLSIALAAALCLSLSITAFAADDTITDVTTGNSSSHDILATTDITTGGTVYSVDVTWGDMAFTYTKTEGEWNPDTLTTGSGNAGAWSVNTTDGDKITITNRSNADIYAAVNTELNANGLGATTTAEGTSTTGISYNDNAVTLSSANNNPSGVGTAYEGKFSVALSGDPQSTYDSSVIGTATVTISAAA